MPRPAMPMPSNPPVPTPRPDPLATDMEISQPQPAGPLDPLRRALAGNSAGGKLRQMIRAFGAGAGGGGSFGGDPFSAFGAGFGGAQGYYGDKEQLDAATAAATEEKVYERKQDAFERAQSEADLELRRAADARSARMAKLNEEKSAQEIKRMARMNGLTISQALEIERIAQAAGENLYGEDREKAIEAKRKQLLETYGGTGQSGLSDRGGLSKGAPQPGTVIDNHRFNGGDPNDQNNWTPLG
jgi:hypothetical protein